MGPKKKAAEKPKGKEAGAGGKAAKGKGGGKDNKAADRDKPTKLKGGQKIDVQHILVSLLPCFCSTCSIRASNKPSMESQDWQLPKRKK